MNDDLEVIDRMIAGETNSFRVLVEKYQRPLLSMIRGLVPGRCDGEEIAQEVFLAAYSNLHTFNSR